MRPSLLKQNTNDKVFWFQDCPDGSDESEAVCDEALVRRRKEDKARIVSGGLQIAREEVIETESDEDNDDHDDLMRLNPCSVWPPVCGQVCISEPHQVKQTQIIVWREIRESSRNSLLLIISGSALQVRVCSRLRP